MEENNLNIHRKQINSKRHPLEEMPSFEEHMQELKSEKFDIKSLPEKVNLPATNDFIKSIVREYLKIEDSDFGSTAEDGGVLYSALRYDEKSAGEINHEDMRSFMSEVKSDLQKANNEGAFDKIKSTQLGFLTFKSWNLYGGERIHSNEQIHRLYVNAPADKIMDFAHKAYSQLKDDDVPFYFKIHTGTNAQKGPKDSFVLYTSTEHLGDTIKSLKEVTEKNQDLALSLNGPSMLVGKIEPWLGYGSEVSELPDDSYTGIICNAFMESVNNAVSSWTEQHPNQMIGNTTVKQFLEKNDTWKEHRKATQILLSGIPKVDKSFINNFCEDVRKSFTEKGLDPNNLCLTPFARKSILSDVSS